MHLSLHEHHNHDDDHGHGDDHHHGHHDHGSGHHHGSHGRDSAPGPGRRSLLLGIIAVLALLCARSVFFVDETEYAYVTQFGRPVRLYVAPGLAVKWPYQSLRRFDHRLQILEPPSREMLTEDKENLNFEWFACWRIPIADSSGDAADSSPTLIRTYVDRFLQSMGSMDAAERRLEERIQSIVAAEIGRKRLSHLVSLESGQVALDAISESVTQSIRRVAADQFGIEVVDVRIKRFGYPDAVKPAVYAEIRSERERVAVQYRAEGASEKAKTESLADLQRDQLLAQAQRDATRIRGEGEAKAIETLNKAHSADPRFYEFLKTLETYRSVLDDQTTVVLSADSPLLKLLTEGVPDSVDRPAEKASPVQPAAAPSVPNVSPQ